MKKTLQELKVNLMGKKAILTTLSKQLGKLDTEQKNNMVAIYTSYVLSLLPILMKKIKNLSKMP